MLRKKILNISLIVLALLLFLKIDYRFTEFIGCCGDDHDYYMHAETLALDFDFDYSNQLLGYENSRFNKNNKIAPIGFIGAGLLAAPFLYLGNAIEIFVEKYFFEVESLFNLKILFYSFSSIFYLFFTLLLILRILVILELKFNVLEVVVIFAGSGLPYYAFERFSMTHTYEAFMSSLIFYLSIKFYSAKRNQKLYAILLPLAIAIGLSIRWVNYFFLFIPLIARYLLYRNKSLDYKLTKTISFYISLLFSSGIFLFHTKLVYGQYTISPQFVYGTESDIIKFVSSENTYIEFITQTTKNVFVVLFSQEFGLFWFSPVLFFGFLYLIIIFFTNKTYTIGYKLFLTFSYLQVLFIVLLWKSTASSYGFRYLFCLIPLSIIIYFDFKSIFSFKFLNKYIILFSIFSLFSLLFFETTTGTQLSLEHITNSFGESRRYSQPEYLSGYLFSFFDINSYLKIFTTSFLGALSFKMLLNLFGYENLISMLLYFGLPVDREDFVIYIEQVSTIENFKFLLVIFIVFGIVYFTVENIKSNIK